MQNSLEHFNEILERLEIISKQENELPQIEKDIILEKLRKIYLNIVGIQNSQTIEQEETVVSQESEKEVEIILEKKHDFAVEKGLDDDVDLFFDTEHESYNKNISEIQNIDIEEQDAAEENPEKEVPIQEPVVVVEEKKVEEPVAHEEDDLLQFIPQPAAEKPVEVKPRVSVETPVQKPVKVTATEPKISTQPQRSLNDLFNEQKEDRSLSAQFQHAKVQDLTKAISINDKFTFIKELFNNRGEDFSAAIQTLNQCENMEAAFDCLEHFKKKHFWDTTSTAYLSLCDLLRRKFM